MDEGKFLHIPIDEVTKPKDGASVMANRWWTVHKEGCISVYVGGSKPDRMTGAYRIYSPQCNRNELIANRNGEKRAIHLPFVYFMNLLSS